MKFTFLPHLWPTLLWLVGLVTLVFILGSVSASKFVRRYGKVFVVPLLTLFGSGCYSAFGIWSDAQAGFVVTILVWLFLAAFFCGGNLIAFQGISYVNSRSGGVTIDKDRFNYKWPSWEDTVAGQIEEWVVNPTLCSSSWAIVITTLIFLLFPVAGLLLSIILFLYGGCNVITNMRSWLSEKGEMIDVRMRSWGGIPLSPGLLLGVVTLGYFFVQFPGPSIWALVSMLSLIAASLLIIWLSDKIALKRQERSDKQANPPEERVRPSKPRPEPKNRPALTGQPSNVDRLLKKMGVVRAFFLAFMQRVCPIVSVE